MKPKMYRIWKDPINKYTLPFIKRHDALKNFKLKFLPFFCYILIFAFCFIHMSEPSSLIRNSTSTDCAWNISLRACLRACLKTFLWGILNGKHKQKGENVLRQPYTSDISREQFNLISRDLEFVKKRTRPRIVDLYEVFCAILYLLKNGCTWRNLPHDFPNWKLVNYYYGIWTKKDENGESVLEPV